MSPVDVLRAPLQPVIGDAPAISSLLARSAPTTVPMGVEEVEAAIGEFLVVKDSEGLVVACVARRDMGAEHVELKSLTVSPVARGQGLGALLAGEVLWRCALEHRPVRCITIEPGFFERLGFAHTGIEPRPRPAHPLSAGTDRFLMECAAPERLFTDERACR